MARETMVGFSSLYVCTHVFFNYTVCILRGYYMYVRLYIHTPTHICVVLYLCVYITYTCTHMAVNNLREGSAKVAAKRKNTFTRKFSHLAVPR